MFPGVIVPHAGTAGEALSIVCVALPAVVFVPAFVFVQVKALMTPCVAYVAPGTAGIAAWAFGRIRIL